MTLTAVLGGGYYESLGGGMTELPSMSVVVKPAQTLHANQVDARGAHCLVVEFSAESVQYAELFPKPSFIILSRGAEIILKTLVSLGRCDAQQGAFELESLAIELATFAGLETRSREVRPGIRLKRVVERLTDSPTGTPTLDDLAKEAGCHPMYLTRLFRKAYGESIGCYARRIRIGNAARAIAENDRGSLSRIAQAAGYYDHSHLTHEFRSRTGITPRQWRGLLRS
jgi:AraC family transcriptional regulator